MTLDISCAQKVGLYIMFDAGQVWVAAVEGSVHLPGCSPSGARGSSVPYLTPIPSLLLETYP